MVRSTTSGTKRTPLMRLATCCAAVFSTLGLTIVVAALTFYGLFVRGLDADHVETGGTAIMMVVVVPALGLSALLGTVSMPAAALLLIRVPGSARTPSGLYVVVVNILLTLVLGAFGLAFLKVWLTM